MAKLPAVSTLRKLSPSPAPSPGAINCEDLHFSHPITFLSILSSGFLLKLFLLWGLEGEGFQLGVRGCHRSLLCFSFSTVWLQYHWGKKAFFVLGNMDHLHPHGLWWRHGPQFSAWSQVTQATLQIIEINMALSYNMHHGHRPGPWEQQRRWTCPLLVAWATDTNMDTGKSTVGR